MGKVGRPRSTSKVLTTYVTTKLADDEVEALDKNRGDKSRAAVLRLALLAWLGIGAAILAGCGGVVEDLPPGWSVDEAPIENGVCPGPVDDHNVITCVGAIDGCICGPGDANNIATGACFSGRCCTGCVRDGFCLPGNDWRGYGGYGRPCADQP